MRNRTMKTLIPTCIMVTVILTTVTAPVTAAQETGTIEGIVRLRGTTSPVANARVQLVRINVLTISGEDGRYNIASVPPGTYTLLVQALGYQPNLVSRLRVEAGRVTTVDLDLRARTMPLDPIEVEARPALDRKATANVSILRKEELPPDGDIVLAALQGRFPGFNLSFGPGESRSPARAGGATVVGPNGRRVLWVLDGVTVEGNLGVHVNSSDVECIEVRRGSQSTLQFLRGAGSRSSGVYGGVILIWTQSKARRMTGACAAPRR